MIHSMSGGVIRGLNNYTYVFVKFVDSVGEENKRWFISPNVFVTVGDKVEIPVSGGVAVGEILRVESVTEQTAPFPVKRTAEIIRVIYG